MGTRAYITIYDEDDTPICKIFSMFDGYLNGIGKRLTDYLRAYRYVTGIPPGVDDVYNGMEDLAAQLVCYLKEGRPGNVYLVPLDRDSDPGYEYEIRFKNKSVHLRELTQQITLYPEMSFEEVE